jgi:hypothetical protein
MIEQTAPYWSLIVMGIVVFAMSFFLRGGAKTGAEPDDDAGKNIPRLPEKAGAALPATLTLTRLDGADVFAGLALAVMAEETLVAGGGMKRVGDFTVGEFPGLSIRAYTHPDKSLVAALYRDENGLAWLNLITEYADGRVVTTSSAPEGSVAHDRPNGMPLYNHPGFEPRQLLRRHKLSIRAVELRPAVPPEEFPAFFTEVYGRLRVHATANAKAQEGKKFFGARVAATLGGTGSGENEGRIPDPTPAILGKWLSAAYRSANVPLAKRRQFSENLVWVIEGAQMEAIARAISRYSTVSVVKTGNQWVIRDDSGAETPFDPTDINGPALFDKINSILPEPARFNRLDAGIKNVIFYSRGSL